MASCSICGCAGWIFRLSEGGLCSNCDRLSQLDVRERLRAVEEASVRAERTADPRSKIENLGRVVSNLEALAEHERRGVKTPGLSAQEELARKRGQLELEAVDDLKSGLDETLQILKDSEETGASLQRLEDLRLKVEDYRSRLGDPEAFSVLESMLQQASAGVRLSQVLDSARTKAETGDREGAKKSYRRSLTILRAAGLSKKDGEDRKAWIEDQIAALDKTPS